MNEKPLVQWTFLQYKKAGRRGSAATVTPVQGFLQTATQIGSKILIYGGCSYFGDAQRQLLIYDTVTYQWVAPNDAADFQEDHPGARYGHTATLVEMHPPKIMVWGGMINGGTFEFDAPDGMDNPDGGPSSIERPFMSWRRKGKQNKLIEETDEAVYFLELNAESWKWSKPLVHGNRASKPSPRAEHSACKSGVNTTQSL